MPREFGSINRAKTEAGEYARRIIDDPEYINSLRARAIAGTLAPGLEVVLLYFALGKPVERTLMTVSSNPFVELSDHELALRAELIAKQLRANNDANDPDDGSGDVH